MISEWSCDTEDWDNGCWKSSFAIIGINYIYDLLLNYSKTHNSKAGINRPQKQIHKLYWIV